MINSIILIAVMASGDVTASEAPDYRRGNNFLISFEHCGDYTNVVYIDGGKIYHQAVDFNRDGHQQEAVNFVSEFAPHMITKVIIPCEH